MDDFHLNKISQKNDAVQGNKKLTSFYIPKDRLEQDVVQLKKSGQQKYLINNVTDRLKSFINKKSVSFGSSAQQEEKPSDEVCKKRQADLENMGVKICSRPLSRLSNEKYNKALSLIGSVDENYIGMLVNLENDYFNRVPELSGIFKNHYFIKDIAELNDFKYNTALNHIKQKKEKNPDNFDDEFFLYKIVMDKSLDDNQFLRAINMLNQGFDIDKITAIVKASTKSDNCNLIAEYLSLSTIKDLAEKNVIDDILDSKNFNEQTMPLIKQISNANNLSDDTKNKLTQYLLLPSIENLCDIPIYDKTLIISNLKDIINKGIIIDGKNYIFNDDEINLLQIPSLIKNMEKSINYTITPTDITEQEMEVFAKDFLANNNKNIENTLKSTDFTQFGKQGLPLKYSRQEFLNDLNEKTIGLSEKEKNGIFKKLEITPVKQNNKITGYDGIINLNRLDLNNPTENAIYNNANRFIKQNEVITSDGNLNKVMNGLIKGMPEFINIIGKQQHSTHDSALDIHILRVLNGVMSNPKYESLPNSDKTILKLAVIMHDIAKPEGVNDANHPNTSALYADNIMQKYSFNAVTKDRIYELIKNHHWLEHYNQGINDAKDTAALFRHKNDYLMSKIFCEADLKGVSDYIYNLYSTLLSKENQTPVEEEINNINKNGQIIFTSKIIKDELIPRTEYKGKTYKVINFNDLPSDFDLEQFGFLAGTTPDNLRLLIHTAHTAENLRVTNHISDIANESFLCTSLVSLKEKATHWNKRFGVCLEGENVNISNASTSNQESLDKKDFKIFSDSLTNKNKLYFYRETLPKMVKSELNLSDDEYIQLYNQISETRYESQIKDDEIYHAGDKQISGMDIKNAVKKAGDSILQNEKHNEVNIYNPKTKAFIAKTDSIQEIPQSYLDFAFENNLPVFILGA